MLLALDSSSTFALSNLVLLNINWVLNKNWESLSNLVLLNKNWVPLAVLHFDVKSAVFVLMTSLKV